MVVLRKHIAVTKGQQNLFNDSPCFFSITHIPSEELSTEEIVALNMDARMVVFQEHVPFALGPYCVRFWRVSNSFSR